MNLPQPIMVVGKPGEPLPVGLDVWVVTQRPKDMPQYPFVVRRQIALDNNRIVIDPMAYAFYELEDARRWLTNKGLTRLDRDPSDDPVIVESWL